MATIGNDLQEAARLLRQGELVAIPTETVYGLAANALNATAVARIFEAKQRPSFDPLIVHVANRQQALEYAESVPAKASALMDEFWPGPLTILLPRRKIIPDIVTSGLDTVGLRCPRHELTLQLLQHLNFPLAAPSANPFGYVSPTTAQHVNDQLGNEVPYILDGGACQIGIESTVVGFEDDQARVYRLGGLTVEQLEEVIGPVQAWTHSSSNPKAPGQLKSHYAPLRRLVVGSIEEEIHSHTGPVAIISFQRDYGNPFQFILSPTGDLLEASRNLFTALREMDQTPTDLILTEWVPNHGLGRAINDRLLRAAAQRD